MANFAYAKQETLGHGAQIITISRPSAYAEYESYYFVYADVHFILHPCFYDEFDSISKPKKPSATRSIIRLLIVF